VERTTRTHESVVSPESLESNARLHDEQVKMRKDGTLMVGSDSPHEVSTNFQLRAGAQLKLNGWLMYQMDAFERATSSRPSVRLSTADHGAVSAYPSGSGHARH
jgi:hypothetical protein